VDFCLEHHWRDAAELWNSCWEVGFEPWDNGAVSVKIGHGIYFCGVESCLKVTWPPFVVPAVDPDENPEEVFGALDLLLGGGLSDIFVILGCRPEYDGCGE